MIAACIHALDQLDASTPPAPAPDWSPAVRRQLPALAGLDLDTIGRVDELLRAA